MSTPYKGLIARFIKSAGHILRENIEMFHEEKNVLHLRGGGGVVLYLEGEQFLLQEILQIGNLCVCVYTSIYVYVFEDKTKRTEYIQLTVSKCLNESFNIESSF